MEVSPGIISISLNTHVHPWKLHLWDMDLVVVVLMVLIIRVSLLGLNVQQ